ncbi:MAG: hypothetical protein IKF90_05705 [Parasporobacterium sp.]|nr:hypothetical protein [Parasporobacterium sp.]
MEKKKITFETIATRIVIGIMVLFLLSIAAVFIAVQNGADSLFQMDHDIETKVYEIQQDDSFGSRVYKGYSNAVYAAKNTADAYSRDLLLGRTKMVEAAVRYKNLIGWKLYAPGEYNSILYLDDGYLANANTKESEESIQKIATKIKSLKDCAEKAGARFLYMQTPGNIDKYGDHGINNVKDFANANADLLLKDLREYGIDCFDLRDNIHETFPDYHSIFYRTDHHWKHPIAVWAAGELTSFLNTQYGDSFDPSLYESARYRSEILPAWYLGSLGRRATLAASEPDDFEIFYPEFPVNITFQIEEKGIEKTGDFSCTIDYEEINDPDIYHRECYLALLSFIGCGRARVVNNNPPNNTEILIVGDSLAIPETSLLALNCRQCELIDPRYFKESIKDYISEHKPDIVINTYSTTIIQDYYSIFDFDAK